MPPESATRRMVPMRHIRAKSIFPGRVRGVMVEYQRERFAAEASAAGREIDPKAEYRQFKTALRSAQLQLASEKKMMLDRRKKKPSEIQALDDAIDVLESHIMTLDDPYFLGEIKNRIFNTGATAAAALGVVIALVSRQFSFDEGAQNSHFMKDMNDMKRRILFFLGLGHELTLPDGADIVAAERLTVSEVLALKRAGARAIILGETSDTAHELVMLRAVRIASVSVSDSKFFRLKKPQPALVDADIGYLVLNPREKARFVESRPADDAPPWSVATKLKSGEKILLSGTLHFASELEPYPPYTQGVIGLYRTEYQISEAGELPAQRQLLKHYDYLLKTYPELEITYRLFDFSEDKNFLAHPLIEKNRAVRGARFLRQEKKILESQLNALGRAAADTDRPIRILIPYVTDLGEIELVRALLGKNARVKIGVMLENVAAVFSAHLWLKQVDFFYVGTSDLLSSIANERREETEILNRTLLGEAYAAMSRELLRIARQRPLTLCGELTAEPWAIAYLTALGFRNFVMPTHRIGVAANMINAMTLQRAKQLAQATHKISDERSRLEYARAQALEILYGES